MAALLLLGESALAILGLAVEPWLMMPRLVRGCSRKQHRARLCAQRSKLEVGLIPFL